MPRRSGGGGGDYISLKDHNYNPVLVCAECCFTSTETVGLLGTGAQGGHLDFHTAPEPSSMRKSWTCIYIYIQVHGGNRTGVEGVNRERQREVFTTRTGRWCCGTRPRNRPPS